MPRYDCTRCGAKGLDSYCATCQAAWANRRDAATMTPDERLAEFNSTMEGVLAKLPPDLPVVPILLQGESDGQ